MGFRQLEVLLELIRVKKTTIPRLAEQFEVSGKTIARDLDRLSASGFPVRCERGRGGGVLIDPNFKLDKSTFTPEDISDIALAMHLLASVRGKQHRSSVMTKLAMVVPELTLEAQANFERYLSIDLPAYDEDANNNAFETLNDALENEVLVLFEAHGQSMRVAPLGYVLKSSGLFLYCHEQQTGYRCIALSCISRCRITEQEFDRAAYQDYEPQRTA